MTLKLLLAPLLGLALSAAADEAPPGPAMPAAPVAEVIPADEDGIDRAPKTCHTRSGLRKTAVADDRTVLFIGRKDIHINVLRSACPGLARGTAISYRGRSGRTSPFCRGDTIRPEGYGVTCTLGSFYEVSEAQARALLNPIEAWSLESAVGFDTAQRPPD
jgi:hypothetical protein